MTTDDERWTHKLAARKQRATEIDELACALCELEGGDAEVEFTGARNEVFAWTYAHCRQNDDG